MLLPPALTHIAAVIDKPGQVPTFRSINNGVLIDPEQITAPNTLLLVPLFPHVSDDLSKKKTKTFDYHFQLHTAGKYQNNHRIPGYKWTDSEWIIRVKAALSRAHKGFFEKVDMF